MSVEHFNALPEGYRLNDYTVKSILGHGGFGITYLAWDENLNKEVAIKEYLPAEFAVRLGTETVRPRSSADEEDYEWGLDRFMKEAQTLALFRHQAIVPVFRFFTANGTAYMVMEYQEGESLAALMKQHRGEFTEQDLIDLVVPILDGLEEVHKAGYLHRDVKPGNIYIRQDGSPVLLDFGAARSAIGRKSQNLTSIVTPGYAPLEQYFADGNQGPWTDIYSLAAILYQAISGRIPPEAPARVKNDPIILAQQAGAQKFSPVFLAAIDCALSVEEEDRPQTATEWRDMLIGRVVAAPAVPVATEDGGATILAGSPAVAAASLTPAKTSMPTARALPQAAAASPFSAREPVTETRQKGASGLKLALISGLVVLLVALGGGAAYVGFSGDNIFGLFGDDKAKAEEERKRKEVEVRRLAEEKRKREEAAQAEKRKLALDAKRAEDDRKRREAAVRKLEDERRRAEEARRAEERRRAEEEQERKAEEVRKAEEERKRRELANLPKPSCGSLLNAFAGMKTDAVDCFYIKRVFQSALNTGTIGSVSSWRNRRSGRRGTLTILKTDQLSDGTYCRTFEQTLTSGGRTLRSRGRACLQGSNWRIEI